MFLILIFLSPLLHAIKCFFCLFVFNLTPHFLSGWPFFLTIKMNPFHIFYLKTGLDTFFCAYTEYSLWDFKLVLNMSCKYLMLKVALEMQSPWFASGKRIVNIRFNTALTV